MIIINYKLKLQKFSILNLRKKFVDTFYKEFTHPDQRNVTSSRKISRVSYTTHAIFVIEKITCASVTDTTSMSAK